MTTASNAALSDLMADAYQSVHKMIWGMVHKYHRRYGGDRDELMSLANLCFMEAVDTWEPTRGALTTHVYWRVYYGLRSEARRLWKQGGFINANRDNDETALVARRSFDLEHFLAELSDDARAVALAALDLGNPKRPLRPEDLAQLLAEAGWAGAEILKCFNEIRKALL